MSEKNEPTISKERALELVDEIRQKVWSEGGNVVVGTFYKRADGNIRSPVAVGCTNQELIVFIEGLLENNPDVAQLVISRAILSMMGDRLKEIMTAVAKSSDPNESNNPIQ